MNRRCNAKIFGHLTWPVLCAAVCLGSASALAADPDAARGDVPQVKVYYGDLNLQRPASVASLYRRIERAADRLCTRSNGRAVQQIHAIRRCTEQVVDRAVVTINLPALAQHASETKARASQASGG